MSDIDYSFGDYEDAPESGDNRSEYRLAASASVTLELESPIPDVEGDQSGRSLVSRTSDVSCLLYTSPSPRDLSTSRMPSSA